MTSRKNNSGGKQYSWNSLTGQNKLFKRYVYVQILVSKEEIQETPASYPRLQVQECVCEDDVEHSVGSAALFVHVCGCHCARFISF